MSSKIQKTCDQCGVSELQIIDKPRTDGYLLGRVIPPSPHHWIHVEGGGLDADVCGWECLKKFAERVAPRTK